MEPLIVIGFMAIFFKWKFASPYLPSATLKSYAGWKRHSPFILFLAASCFMAFAFRHFDKAAFLAALGAGMAMAGFAVVLACRDAEN